MNNNNSIAFPNKHEDEPQTVEETLLSTEKPTESAILLGTDLGKYDVERSMQELSALAQATGITPVAEVIQKLKRQNAQAALGKGRIAEAALLANNLNATLAIFDGELTGSQIRNLSEMLNLPVIDRTMLILEIFSSRATTKEGKTQTELATLEYRLPRLSGLGGSMSRQGGGGGGGGGARRGGGETKLEYDRRYIRGRITMLKTRLAEMKKRRDETRREREKSGVPVIALVGYTNVGKSSLVNALTGSTIAAADMLFATLDPTARKLELPDGQNVVLIDTVGFVSRLPHKLIEAFKSTLEEAKYADLLLCVCDASDPLAATQLAVTSSVLDELSANSPRFTVCNKCDKAQNIAAMDPSCVAVSAKTGEGLSELLSLIAKSLESRICKIEILLPYSNLALADVIRNFGNVIEEDYRENGVFYKASIEKTKAHLFKDFLV